VAFFGRIAKGLATGQPTAVRTAGFWQEESHATAKSWILGDRHRVAAASTFGCRGGSEDRAHPYRKELMARLTDKRADHASRGSFCLSRPSELPFVIEHASEESLSRRGFCAELLGTLAAIGSLRTARTAAAEEQADFQFRYILGSCMYGDTELAEIVPEVRKTGATALDIWPRIHGNQREQLDEMGEAAFTALLERHDLQLGCITQYPLGPFRLQNEMRLAQRLKCPTMVTGASGPKGLAGSELKAAIQRFVEQMKPHLEVAAETGVTIAIENHANSLIESPDSMKWLAELRGSPRLAIAFAPYHLPQDELLLSQLICDLGDAIAMFYAWQHGLGCHEPRPKAEELLQMPGRGELDFRPLVAALREIRYTGWTEIFMHPVPRGIPILDSTSAVTAEINRARDYLAECLREVASRQHG
jgi:sugar phosphate isomerase/epimerase